MKTFVLMVLLWGGQSPNETMTAEFNSRASCEAAAAQVEATWGGAQTWVYPICMEK